MPEVSPHLTLARVRRAHALLEELRLRSPGSISADELADRLGVATRTIERDVARLRDAGVPITPRTGPGGGYSFAARDRVEVELSAAEVAALIASLAELGPGHRELGGDVLARLVAALATSEDR